MGLEVVEPGVLGGLPSFVEREGRVTTSQEDIIVEDLQEGKGSGRGDGEETSRVVNDQFVHSHNAQIESEEAGMDFAGVESDSAKEVKGSVS